MSRKPQVKGRAARLARMFPARRGQAARTPFVLLVVLLLGGGLIGLLVLNSALSEGSFKLDDLQKETKSLTDEEQALQRDVDAYSAPEALQRRAHELGMVPGGDPAFLGLDGTVKGFPSPAAQPEDAPLVLAPEVIPAGPAPTQSPTATPADTASPTATATAIAPTAAATASSTAAPLPPQGAAEADRTPQTAPMTTPGR